jgi:hypothetical protein
VSGEAQAARASSGLEGDVSELVDDIEDRLADLRQAISEWTWRSDGAAITPGLIRWILKARRARDRIFGGELFADPAWDMLLDAFAAHLASERLAVTALCRGAAVPATTALRWLGKLEADGLLTRKQDEADGRRHWIELSPRGVALMQRYFESIGPVLPR